MKKVKLFLYNCGRITQIADFKNAGHDAMICVTAMNDNQIKAHGYLTENIFYYLQWNGKTSEHITVRHSVSGNTDSQCMQHEALIKLRKFKNELELVK